MKDSISYNTFAALDMVVGQILSAQPVEKSDKLLELSVNLGETYGTVTILSGIAKYYTPEDLEGKKFIFLANLEPRSMMGKTSQGMLLAADIDGIPKVIEVSPELAVGTAIC